MECFFKTWKRSRRPRETTMARRPACKPSHASASPETRPSSNVHNLRDDPFRCGRTGPLLRCEQLSRYGGRRQYGSLRGKKIVRANPEIRAGTIAVGCLCAPIVLPCEAWIDINIILREAALRRVATDRQGKFDPQTGTCGDGQIQQSGEKRSTMPRRRIDQRRRKWRPT